MKILALDIETSPAMGYFWGLFDQHIGLNQVVSTSEVICFAAKYIGEPNKAMRFHSVHKDGRKDMVQAAWTLLDETDAVLHYNGKRFDIPHLNREFIEQGLGPPSPFTEIDLLQTSRKQFKFLSNKLEHVSTQLSLEGKIKHEGFELWLKCMDGDDAAWKRMEKYNRRDVTLLEDMYKVLLPWIPNHPNAALIDGYEDALIHVCPRCKSNDLQRRGSVFTKVSEFQRYQCKKCGSYSRSSKRLKGYEGAV